MPTPVPDREASGIREKVRFLRHPGAYARLEGAAPAAVHAVETHMAWVFLTDRFAWKLKKPVRYPFLDFGTLEARHRDCLDEVALNARLAPGVYLGVVPLARSTDGRLALGGAGPVVDWLVRMRRLPADRFLAERLRRGAGLEPEELEHLAGLMAGFYREAAPAGLSGEAYRARLGARIVDDLDTLALHDHDAEAAQEVGMALIACLDRSPAVFDARAERVVEGHGDLRPEHIWLGTPPAVIDCLEFNQDFRVLDPAEELAFLAMECELAGAPAVGEAIARAVLARLGDQPPARLVSFYKAARALLRAKLAFCHVWDVERDDHERWRARGRDFLRLARLHAAAA